MTADIYMGQLVTIVNVWNVTAGIYKEQFVTSKYVKNDNWHLQGTIDVNVWKVTSGIYKEQFVTSKYMKSDSWHLQRIFAERYKCLKSDSWHLSSNSNL